MKVMFYGHLLIIIFFHFWHRLAPPILNKSSFGDYLRISTTDIYGVT